MYAIVDPKSFWPQQMPLSAVPANQIYMTPVPATPTYLIGGTPQMMPVPGQQQMPAMIYNVQPGWYQYPFAPAATTSASLPASRPRVSSDDVFLTDNNFSNTVSHAIPIPIPFPDSSRRRRQRALGDADDMSLTSDSTKGNTSTRARRHSETTSSDSSVQSSPISSDGTSSRSSPSTRSSSPTDDEKHDDIHDESHQQSSPKETTDVNLDNTLYNIFTTSLYSALNRDPPEPTGPPSGNKAAGILPLKTSSPIQADKISNKNAIINHQESEQHQVVNLNQLQTQSTWFPTNLDMEALPVDQLQQQQDQHDGQGGKRREKFLRALEEERERQRCLSLPKHAPKMNCKFCKNNGESAEVYTKHRLHYKEKTACPLLRLYVCRLCNSTGDFAHTIRHCPFNSRFDRVAWKATFL